MRFNRKKSLAVILLVAMMLPLCMFSANAALLGDGNGMYYQFNGDDTASLAEYKGTNKNVAVPSHIYDTPIVEVYGKAFRKNTNIESVTIPDSVTTLGDLAFYGCTSLKSVELSNSISRIESATFYNCSALEKVVMPASITYIAANSFNGAGDVTIYCYKNSYAQEFAISKNIKYVLMDCIMGDINLDGSIDITDVTLLQKGLIGLSSLDNTQTYCADVNGDGVVSITDATEIQKYLVGIESALD